MARGKMFGHIIPEEGFMISNLLILPFITVPSSQRSAAPTRNLL